MNILIALAVGYLIGARTGGKDLEQLSRSLKALCETDEFADVMTAARAQVGATLRELASIVDGGQPAAAPAGDLVSRVRHMVGRDAPSASGP